MRNHLFKMSLSFCALLLLVAPAFGETITINADPWCPYNCAAGAEKPGYMIEVAKAIFEKAGLTIKYENMPWPRCIDFVQKGKIDAIVGATKGEAEGCVFPDEAFGFTNICFFVKKGSAWQYQNLESLKQVKVGIQAEYEYGATLDEYFAQHKNTPQVQEVSADEPLVLNIRKLLKDRIDAIPEDKSAFLYTAMLLGVSDQVTLAGATPIESEEDFESRKVFIAFAPNNPNAKAYAQLFSEGVKEMRASGALTQILAKYGLTDWKADLDAAKTKLGNR
jgi:polar amino acid transport system substrate-binding protein